MPEFKHDERVINVSVRIVAGNLIVKAEGTMDEMETIRVLHFAIDAMEQQMVMSAKIDQATRIVIPDLGSVGN